MASQSNNAHAYAWASHCKRDAVAPTRILIIADDDQIGRWLQHRIDTLGIGGRIDLANRAGFEQQLAATDAGAVDVLVAALDFSPQAAAASFEWIDRALAPAGAPPLVIVADHGDEAAAVTAMRHGAADYLPRHLLTPEQLATSLRCARTARREAPLPHHSDETTAAVLPQRLPRDLIPRYLLLDTLGESMRATVYLAHSAALNRHVALKVSRNSDDGEPQFACEFETAGGLRHPAVVDIYDYGIHDGREFIAMEYFPCGDLKARLQNPISEDQCIAYLRRIASALSVVHAQGLVHRDLKPPNIMLREAGEVVLIDFGIAKRLQDGGGSTHTGVLRGSPYYMSPEQAQGEELDGRSDLYSLGVIFYEMLTGAKPYLGASAVEVLQQHVNGPMPQLSPVFAQHQPLLESMMAKDRNERFESADALLESLHSVAA
jgi:DNA-binding NarL/FixJ family response regulator